MGKKPESPAVPASDVAAKDLAAKKVAIAKTPVAAAPQAETITPPCEEVVRVGAYLRWDAAGRPGGDGVRFWLEAEQELMAGPTACKNVHAQ